MPVHNRFYAPPGGVSPYALPSRDALLRIGPVLPVEVGVPSALAEFLVSQGQTLPHPVSGWALVDTGATRSGVDSEAISSLGVSPIGITHIGTAGGRTQRSLFPAKLNFPDAGMEIEFSSVVGVALAGLSVEGQPIIVLIGRDVLSRCVFIYNGAGGFFTLAL